jgi:HK97 family phage portal protein
VSAIKQVLRLGGTGVPFRTPLSQDIIYTSPWEHGTSTNTGKSVTHDSAMGFIPVFAAVRLLSSTVAGLPLLVYRRTASGEKERATDHELYPLLHDAPNPEMTSFTWRQVMMSHLLTWGNCYSEIEYDTRGGIIGLWPLRPDRMTVVRRKGMREYDYRHADGTTTTLPARNVFHVPGLGYDGLVGYSPITLARQAIALGLAAEEWAARFYSNNATPPTVLKFPGKLSDDARARLRSSWEGMHKGLSNAHRTAILEEGLDVGTIGVNAKDAQFMDSRRFQAREVAMLYGIPPHMIGDVERSTSWGTGIEEQGRGFVTYTLNSYLFPFEQQIDKDLIRGEDVFSEFLREGLLIGSTEQRYRAYAVAQEHGWINAEYIAKRENLPVPPAEVGQVYYHSQNMQSSVREETPTELTLDQKIEAVGALVRAGFDPQGALAALGMSGIPHTGLEPVTVSEQTAKAIKALKDEADKRDTQTAETFKATLDAIRQLVAERPVSVNVESPVTNIHEGAIKADVATPPVQVDVHVPEPKPRRVRKDVVRDDAGVIAGLIETEE